MILFTFNVEATLAILSSLSPLLKKNNIAIEKLTVATNISITHAIINNFLPQGAVLDLGKNL